jgi:hypothetical protein
MGRLFRETSMVSFTTLVRGPALVLALAAGLVACGGGSEFEQVGPGPAPGSVAADWSAPDVNPASPTYNTLVSPRQRLGLTSAWYFAHAT